MAKDNTRSDQLETLLFEDPEEGNFDIVEDGAPKIEVREDRALVSLDIAFTTTADAVRAYSENVGVGQVSIITNDTLRKGTEVTVRLRVPGWTSPLQAVGKVTWSRPDAMGIAFTELKRAEQDRLRKLVVENTTMVERMRRQFSRQAEVPAPAQVHTRKTTLVQLVDEMFSDVVSELLSEHGYITTTDPVSGSKPNVIVAEMSTAAPVADAFKLVPLVLVNASGPNELARARMPFLRAKAFVPRPASAAKVVQAVQQVFRER